MKEFMGIGRGYLLLFVTMFCATTLAAVTLFKQPAQYVWVLDWYKDLVVWLVPLGMGAKVFEKIGVAFGGKK